MATIRISTTFYIIGDTLHFSRDIGENIEGKGGSPKLQTTDDNLNELFKNLMNLLSGGGQ